MASDTDPHAAHLRHRNLTILQHTSSSASKASPDGTVASTPGSQAPTILSLDISGTDQTIVDAVIEHDSDNELANRSEDEEASRLVQNEPRKPRKISQKKKIEQASFGVWLQDNRNRLSKKPENPAADNDQSIGYLVKSWEGQKIINNPREYQMELFERAKEKNTIAVLDTGESQTVHAPQPSGHTSSLTMAQPLGKDLGRL